MSKLVTVVGIALTALACGPAGDSSSLRDGLGHQSGEPSGEDQAQKKDGASPGEGGAGGAALGGQGGGAPAVGADVCDNGLDDDGNGQVDDGCGCAVGNSQQCFLGDPALAGKGPCNWGTQQCVDAGSADEFTVGKWGPCEGSGKPAAETCDGDDDDCNGVVDDGCECTDGSTQPCQTKCGDGKQKCLDGKWSACDGPQPDQNGNCTLTLNLNVDGDCVCAPACPPQAPFPIGCKIDFQGGNPNGCVAWAGSGKLYFQEGVKCNAGHLTGYVICSSVAGPPLNAANCPINKPSPHYGTKPSDCPEIDDGDPDSCYF
ncbi:MAG: hypothetical protein HY744_06490 [Deltaproteobacteria bacterium]|nr:hypothetical protein [Deltaproteobacteria bacterium]